MSEVEWSAILSNCGTYRYSLHRSWGRYGTMTFVMLNPSTADAEVNDPTVRRCMGFARRENCQQVVVVNLFAFRATSPKDLFKAEDPTGPENARTLRFSLERRDGPIVFAWGTHGTFMNADREAIALAQEVGAQPFHLGLTKHGHPRHPLYLRADAPLVPFACRAS